MMALEDRGEVVAELERERDTAQAKGNLARVREINEQIDVIWNDPEQ